MNDSSEGPGSRTDPGVESRTLHRPNPVVQAGWRMAGAFALLMGGLLVAGIFLPGAWSAETSRTVQAAPDSVFALLAAPRRWDEWTPWPDMAFSYNGPESGSGARRSWDAPDIGQGSFTITEADPSALVRYRVDVGPDGGQAILGTFRLEPEGTGTRVVWREEGDFGANPVLAWAALSMRRKHGGELERRMEGLAAAAEAGRAR
jgi:uncharacterized protein YndB with AHSA1/START domain